MIQIPPQITSQPDLLKPKQNNPSDPYILGRIFYTLILVSLLLLMCFYFDLLSDYDLLSMVLGFLVCIILQFTLLSYYFSQQMQQLQMDEIGVLKSKIKLIFGELNPLQLDRKLRQKYYRRQASEEDMLFAQPNDRIYQNVMTHLRGKEEPNFNELTTKVKGKWISLEHKIKLIEDFLTGMLKLYESRKQVYNKHKNRIKKISQSQQHRQWVNFLGDNLEDTPKNDNLNNTSYYSQESFSFHLKSEQKLSEEGPPMSGVMTNWAIFNSYMLQKTKLVQKEMSDIKERVIQEFQSYATTIRTSSLTYSKRREKLHQDYKTTEEEKNHYLQELEKTAGKIEELSASLSTNIEGGDIELILKKQFQLRLLKIQSQNLLIRLSKANSNSLSNADLLFGLLEEENRDLQHYLVIFNRKINQYIQQMAGYGEKRAPALGKHLEEAAFRPLQPDQLTSSIDPEQLYAKIMARRNGQGSLRGHLDQLVRQFQELKQQHSKARSKILEFKNQLQKKQAGDVLKGAESRVGVNTGARILYFASTVNDQKLSRIFQKVATIEERHSQLMREALNRQLMLVRQFDREFGAPFGLQLKRRYEDYKRREDDLRKLKKRHGREDIQLPNDSSHAEFNASRSKLIEWILDYSFRLKVKNILPEIIGIMASHEKDYKALANQIDSETFDTDNQRTNDLEDRKKQKYATFANSVSNKQTEEIIDERLGLRDTNLQLDKQDEVKPSYLINREKSGVRTKQFGRLGRQAKMSDFFRYEESASKSLEFINRILSILFNQWRNSQFFHQFVKEELMVSLNRKKPDIVEHLRLDQFRIIERNKDEPIIKNLRIHPSQIYRCLLDFTLNFKGKIGVKIGSKLKIGSKPNLQIRLLIKQFQCPIRLCFTPFSIGKSYASLLDKPKIVIDYSVKIGKVQLTKIPFFTQFIKTYAVLKLRKKFLWPKRMTLPVPLAFKSSLELAIQQRNNFQKERERLGKKSK